MENFREVWNECDNIYVWSGVDRDIEKHLKFVHGIVLRLGGCPTVAILSV